MLNVHSKLVKGGLLKQMGAPAWAVLTAISIHMDGKNTAFPSKKRIQNLTGLGRDSVTNAIKKLKILNVLKAEQKRKNGKKTVNNYTITSKYLSVFINVSNFKLEEQEPVPSTEFQYAEKEVPHTEIQYAGNQPHTDLPATELPATENQYALSITSLSEVLPVIEVLPSALSQKENKENSDFENSNEAILITTEEREKEKNSAKKEKETPAVAAPAFPPEELRVMAAIEKAMKFFEDWPAMEQKLKENAKISDPDFSLSTEIGKWIRGNAGDYELMRNPQAKISSRFGNYLMRYNQFLTKKSTGYGKSSTTTNRKTRPTHLMDADQASRILSKYSTKCS